MTDAAEHSIQTLRRVRLVTCQFCAIPAIMLQPNSCLPYRRLTINHT